jgi:cyclopropane fatty-acyl-phospholipid synthase-like methyltransferase
MSIPATCTVCADSKTTCFLCVPNMPVSCNHLCSSVDAAKGEPRAGISLAFCFECGHVFNLTFDSKRVNYREDYENSLLGSDRFRAYDEALLVSLLERYRLRGRSIVEIGCGRGQFLRALCERGGNSGIGFDPSYPREENAAAETPRVLIRSQAYEAHNNDLLADFICSRHTLEHIGDPHRFLSTIRNATPRNGVPVFFEVPNALYTLRDGGIWDIIYEHCSYFTPSSLARVFCDTGYEQVEVAETFSGQFLTMHAQTGASRRRTDYAVTPALLALVKSAAQTYRTKVEAWAARLLTLERQGRKAVVWGAGAKATTFLNVLRPRTIEYAVDVNPRKQGKYVIGTGQSIVQPEFLRDYAPDDIICMNPNYLDEIARQLRALGVQATLICA